MRVTESTGSVNRVLSGRKRRLSRGTLSTGRERGAGTEKLGTGSEGLPSPTGPVQCASEGRGSA